MIKQIVASLFALAAITVSSESFAQKGVIQLKEVTIVGRVQKPVASVDVSKMQAKLTLTELRQPFVDRIEEATRNEPF